MAPDITIGYLLRDAEQTKVGSLDDFFSHIATIEKKSGLITEGVVLVSDKTKDKTMEIAKNHCEKAEYFHYKNDMGQLRNSLLEKANGKWVFMPETNMVYDVNSVADGFKEAGDIPEEYKSIESWQEVVHPDGPSVKNLYYFLIKKDSSVKFEGLAFESLRGAFPHEIMIFNHVIGKHYVRPVSGRINDARPLFEKELRQLDTQRTDDPEELYWAAMRYSELGMMNCLSEERTDKKIVSLLNRAIELKEDFGPAYVELTKQHIDMRRLEEARIVALRGYGRSGYEPCRDILAAFTAKLIVIETRSLS